MTDNYALGLFLSNLKPEISTDVQRFYPKDLTHVFNLAKKLEAKLLRSIETARAGPFNIFATIRCSHLIDIKRA